MTIANILDMQEQELRMIWRQANASQGETKQSLLKQYKMKHENYRKTKMMLTK
jgi:hypothetical protein